MDWTGNRNSVFTTLGSSAHSAGERQCEDYYATDPRAAELLLEQVPWLNNVWECACGELHLANILSKAGVLTRASDLIDRCGNEVLDFLSEGNRRWDGDIVTNPPYRYAKEFVEKALSIIPKGRWACFFLKVTFLEGKGRKNLFLSTPPVGFLLAPAG